MPPTPKALNIDSFKHKTYVFSGRASAQGFSLKHAGLIINQHNFSVHRVPNWTMLGINIIAVPLAQCDNLSRIHAVPLCGPLFGQGSCHTFM